jgi:hypothetical protein
MRPRQVRYQAALRPDISTTYRKFPLHHLGEGRGSIRQLTMAAFTDLYRSGCAT